MQIRRQQGRRTATQHGVSGFDRRKPERRGSLDDAIEFEMVPLADHTRLNADYADLSIFMHRGD
jgi:hypothetical protein